MTDAVDTLTRNTTARQARPETQRRGRVPLIMIVDDYPDCREMYAAYLSLSGFRVLKARDGHEALRLARQTLPDLILMDLGLPGMDGCEVTRRLKQDGATRGIPVVALTAQAPLPADLLDVVGFETVITKPCLPDELAEHVRRLVQRHAPPIRRVS